jgi:AraC-like DNA-binding protein
MACATSFSQYDSGFPDRSTTAMSGKHNQEARHVPLALPPDPDAPLPPSLPLDAIRRHIRTNLTARIRVSDIAGIAGLDVFRFARALRRELQTTPYALIIATRIEVAERLLRSGMSVADAAQSVGFCDQSHLTRHFRRRLGLTPSQLRLSRNAESN